jgi:hypothetical protein
VADGVGADLADEETKKKGGALARFFFVVWRCECGVNIDFGL